MFTPTRLISTLLCLILVQHPVAAKNRFNISLEQLDACESLDIPLSSGYAYKDFFVVHKFDNNKVQTNERIHLKFYVLTTMDAHILLSVTNYPRHNDRVYEIVLGAGGNTFSAIRTAMGSKRVSTNQDPYLLSVYDPTPIEIVQTKDGDLSVYIPGFKNDALLHYHDSSPLNVNYVSFSTFGSNYARWFYDCSFDDASSELEENQRKKSNGEELLETINYNAKNRSLPPNLSEIQFSFQMRSLTYDHAASLLRTRIHLLMHWQDRRLSWNPQSYGQLNSIVNPQLEIWSPQLVVLNGALDSLGNTFKSFEIRVQNDGNVTLMANNLELTTWCVDTSRNWPNEQIKCDIEMGIDHSQALISLVYDHLSKPLGPNDHVNTPSGWTFRKMEVEQVENATSMRYSPKGLLQTIAGDVNIGFKLQRNSAFFMHTFVVPLLACQIIIVLSFLLHGYRRGALILVVLMLTSSGLMYLTRHASPHYVPPLMSAYQHIMRVSTFCYLLHIVIMWLERNPPRAKIPPFLRKLIASSPLRMVLGLRFSDATEYCKIYDQPWRQLSKILNNASFIAINICFLILDLGQLST